MVYPFPTKIQFLVMVYKLDLIDWLHPALCKSKPEASFILISRVYITSFSIRVFAEVNFSASSSIPATLVVWESPNNTLWSSTTVYILNIVWSKQTWREAPLSVHHPSDMPTRLTLVIIAVNNASVVRWACRVLLDLFRRGGLCLSLGSREVLTNFKLHVWSKNYTWFCHAKYYFLDLRKEIEQNGLEGFKVCLATGNFQDFFLLKKTIMAVKTAIIHIFFSLQCGHYSVLNCHYADFFVAKKCILRRFKQILASILFNAYYDSLRAKFRQFWKHHVDL